MWYPQLQNMIDPYFYRKRLTMPKLVITGLMDEFQMADDEQYWRVINLHRLPITINYVSIVI